MIKQWTWAEALQQTRLETIVKTRTWGPTWRRSNIWWWHWWRGSAGGNLGRPSSRRCSINHKMALLLADNFTLHQPTALFSMFLTFYWWLMFFKVFNNKGSLWVCHYCMSIKCFSTLCVVLSFHLSACFWDVEGKKVKKVYSAQGYGIISQIFFKYKISCQEDWLCIPMAAISHIQKPRVFFCVLFCF